MRNVFLINVSENPLVVKNQIDNIKKFVSNDEVIVLHISNTTKDNFINDSNTHNLDFYNMESDGIYVNPTNIPTQRGHLLTDAFLSSFDFIKGRVDFGKVVLNSSNQLFFKHGFKEHLDNYRVGLYKIETLGPSGMFPNAKPKPFITKIFGEERKSYWSYHEGSFFDKGDFETISDLIKDNNFDGTSEEQTIPTLFHNLYNDKDLKISPTSVWMNLYLSLDEISAMKLILDSEYEKLRGYVRYGLADSTNTPLRDVMLSGDFLFGIKRVGRTMDCPTRSFINGL